MFWSGSSDFGYSITRGYLPTYRDRIDSHIMQHSKPFSFVSQNSSRSEPWLNTSIHSDESEANSIGIGADVLVEESEDLTAKRAGQICALFTALSTCIGILHAWCMPCTRSVKRPEQPEQAMEQVIDDMNGNHNKWSTCAWCKPVLASWNVPTNGFVCKRLASQQAGSVHGNPDQSVWKV